MQHVLQNIKFTRIVVHGNCTSQTVQTYADIVASELNLAKSNHDYSYASQISIRIARLPIGAPIRWDVLHQSGGELDDEHSNEHMSEQGEEEHDEIEDGEDSEAEKTENSNHIQIYF